MIGIGSVVAILLLPLAAFVIQIFWGKRLPRQGDWISIGAILAGFVLALRLMVQVWTGEGLDFTLTTNFLWWDLGRFQVQAGILVDNLTVVMLLVVTLVSTMIHLYSVGYMHGDSRYSRYYAYLSLFSFSMLGLVLSDNLLTLYVCWELVGLSSYLLIGFWFERPAAAAASMKAFIVNRIGDVGMFLGILIIVMTLGTFHYSAVFQGVAQGDLSGPLLIVAGVALFCGAVGKSAQFPLHVWLPDAMEGPTPVSALIHAATMVAAGVYMVGRLFPFFAPEVLVVIAYIGSITAIMAATIAITQTDIKRVLAYSTISQLGYMIMALGVGGYVAGLFHLATHAFFKALLFLGAGSVIHAVHTQELPEMGGLRHKMPITFWTFLMATLSIAGVPGFAGFFSKDAILAATLAFSIEHPQHVLIPVIGFGAAGITAFYMFRLVFLCFSGKPRDEHAYQHAHESPWVMTVPLIVLGVLSVIAGYNEGWGWFGERIHKPELAYYAAPAQTPALVAASGMDAAADLKLAATESSEAGHGGAHTTAMILSILVAGGGILGAFLTYGLTPALAEKYSWVRAFASRQISPEEVALRFPRLYRLSFHKYYFDEIYQMLVVQPLLNFNQFLARFDLKVIDGAVNGVAVLVRRLAFLEGAFDLKVVDGLVNGIATTTIALGGHIRRLQTGRVQTYVLGALAGIILILVIRSSF